jgi:hypothetical protein
VNRAAGAKKSAERSHGAGANRTSGKSRVRAVPLYEQAGFWACARSSRGAKITTGQKAMVHALLLPLAGGLSRCLTKRLTQWNGN